MTEAKKKADRNRNRTCDYLETRWKLGLRFPNRKLESSTLPLSYPATHDWMKNKRLKLFFSFLQIRSPASHLFSFLIMTTKWNYLQKVSRNIVVVCT